MFDDKEATERKAFFEELHMDRQETDSDRIYHKPAQRIIRQINHNFVIALSIVISIVFVSVALLIDSNRQYAYIATAKGREAVIMTSGQYSDYAEAYSAAQLLQQSGGGGFVLYWQHSYVVLHSVLKSSVDEPSSIVLSHSSRYVWAPDSDSATVLHDALHLPEALSSQLSSVEREMQVNNVSQGRVRNILQRIGSHISIVRYRLSNISITDNVLLSRLQSTLVSMSSSVDDTMVSSYIALYSLRYLNIAIVVSLFDLLSD